MKILFVTGGYNGSSLVLENGPLMLATILNQADFDVQIFDLDDYRFNECQNYSINNNQINIEAEQILSKKPDVVNFYGISSTYIYNVLLAKRVKQLSKTTKVVFGGPQSTLTAEKSMGAFKWIDIIALGEGESYIKDLYFCLKECNDLAMIPSIIYRRNDEIVKTELPCDLINLDDLPTIDYSLVDLSKYVLNNGYLRIEGGRGCPFSCTFCSTKSFWKNNFRKKSVNKMIDEITYIKNEYGIRSFSIVHDLFTVDKKHIIEFCDAIINSNLKIKWRCSSRIDTLDEEIILKMSLSGCTDIYLGVETGSTKIQKLINKNIDIKNSINIINTISQYKIKPKVSLMYGFPNEGEDDLDKTLKYFKYILETESRPSQLHLLGVLPNTEIYNEVKDELQFSEALSDIAMSYDEDLFYDIIREYPDIFPFYYTFKSDLRDKYQGLEIFMNKVPYVLFKKFNGTYSTLMEYYRNDFRLLYLDFKKANEVQYSNRCIYQDEYIQRVASTQKDHLLESYKHRLGIVIDELTSFINKTSFGEFSTVVRNVFKYEKDIINFMYYTSSTDAKYNYDFDVTKYLSSKVLSHNRLELCFKKTDSKLRVFKVD